jgi:hypothetical protein
MKQRVLAGLTALVLCGGLVVAAPSVRIVGPSTALPYTLVELQAEGDLTGAAVLWDVSPDDLADVRELPGGKMIFVGPPGTYRVKCTVVRLKDGQTVADRQRFVVVIGTPGPPPVPPGPNPPGPSPGPVPIPVDGFRVLIVEDAAKRSSLPAQQLNVLFAKDVRDYLDAKCVMGSDGKTHEWRIWSKDTDARAVGGVWPDALKRANDGAKGTYPWLVISTGHSGYEGPLPKDVDRTMELLKKYAEPKGVSP